MLKAVQVLVSCIAWGAIYLFFGLKPNIIGVNCYALLGVVFSLCSIIFPRTMCIGVAKADKASILEKIVPVLICLAIAYGTKYLYPTPVMGIINSYLIGAIFPYLVTLKIKE